MNMEYVDREVAAKASEEHAQILDTESHHDHKIIMNNGLMAWAPNPTVEFMFDHCGVSLNDVVANMQLKGIDKNREECRRLYRDMGYTLRGYWEIFYWDMNNEMSEDYKPPKGNK